MRKNTHSPGNAWRNFRGWYSIYQLAMSKTLILVFMLVSGITYAQSVSQLQNNYTGNINWNSSTGVLKFTSNGTIQFNQNGWKIPANVSKVIIGSGVRIVGRFDWENSGPITIEGENRNTSVLFGTSQTGYASRNGGGDKLSAVRATDGNVTLKNFTALNSKGFGFTHRGGGFMSVIDCNILDTRGGGGNNSDGIVTWGGGLVKGCFLETGDDNIKVYGDITVEDTEMRMVQNSVPVQLGWGNYGNGAVGTFKNIVISGDDGRGNDGNAVIVARSGTYNKTLTFEGITVTNPNAKLVSFRNQGGNFNITMTDVDIVVDEFSHQWNNNVSATIKICGTNYGRGTTKKSFKCGDGANDGGGNNDDSPTDIEDLMVTSIACDEVELSWSDVEGETAYRIRRKIEGEATFTTLGDVNAGVTNYTDNSVAENTTYIYQVRPVVNNRAVKVSNNPLAAVPSCEEPCTLPGGATVSSTLATTCSEGGAITFSFNDTDGRIAIEFSIDGGDTYFPQVDDDAGSFTANNLDAGNYNTYVRWGNNECPTEIGTVTVANNAEEPTAIFTKTDATCEQEDGSITFTFDDTPSRVDIRFSIDGGQTFDVTAANAGTYTFSDLAAGTYQLASKWGNGDCPLDLGTISVGQDECTGGPTDITDLVVTDVTCDQVALSWGDVDGETEYRIRRKIEGEATFTTLGDVNANVTSYTDNAVAENTTYIYQVRPVVNNQAVNISNNPEVTTTECNVTGGDCNGGPSPSAATSKDNPSCSNDDGSITFTFDDTDGRTGIEFSINGGNSYRAQVPDNSGSFTVNNLASGNYQTYVRWGNNDCPVALGTVNLLQPSNCGGGGNNDCEGYEEQNGLIIMEAENTDSPLDKWIKKTDVNGYTGSGHLEFTGNNQSSGPATSPLTYTFKVNTAGTYRLIIKSRKRLAGAEPDKSNDSYVKLAGDFNASPNACNNHNCDAQKADLTSNTKFFGGNADNWGWAQQLDLGGHNNKRNAIYQLKAGKTYTLTVSGRSKNYNFDKIVFYDVAEYTLAQAKNASFSAEETGCSDDNGGGGDNPNCSPWFNNNGVWKGKGRIAISSDGNEHDKDDWAATPFSLALLAAKGLQDQLTLYTYSDHIWGSNHDHNNARQQMRISALEGAEEFGFNNTNFIEAVAAPNVAYNAMRDEINASSANNPLFIIAAGPMQVVGEALDRAQQSKLQYVTVISHSTWNDRHSDNPNSWENHSGWTWNEMVSAFQSKGVTFDHIVDQNGGNGYDGMRANKNKFSWLNTSSARNNSLYKSGSWAWLYDRQEAAQKGSDFDPSDAGMVIYLLTGKEKTDPSDAKAIMESPVAPCAGAALASEAFEISIEEPITAYPVPAQNEISIEGAVAGETIYIMDLAGNILIETENTTSIDISDLMDGIYLIKSGGKTNRFMKGL